MSNSFAASELKLALSEIPWGIRAYRLVPPASTSEARAEVELLEEGQACVVACQGAGWVVVEAQGGCAKPSSVFDTLDDLLLAVSPLFEAKRMEKLFEKLTAVAEQQKADDDDGGTSPSSP
ncbi:hypothetical protein JCM8547_007792 [Rhodosporidiobolus lusitaniae]